MTSSGFSPAEVETFRTQGYLVARGLLDPATCEHLRALAETHLAQAVAPLELEVDVAYPGAPASRSAPGGQTVRRLLQVYARDAAFADAARMASIAERLRQLLGAPAWLSQVHHNCVMTKNPSHSSETHWHRDIRYWAFTREALVSVWIALGREFPQNGCLYVIPGSQAMELDDARFDAAKFLRADLPANQALLKSQVAVTLERGDVLFFHCRLLHAAGDNRTDDTKFSLVFTYHTADNPPLAGTRSAALPEVAV